MTGETQVWFLNGTSVRGSAALDPMLNLDQENGWRLAGIGDFNQDGHPDIVTHNGQTGATEIWYMDGVDRIGVDDLDASLDVTDASGASLVGVCDFDQDGWPDLLWHNGTSGLMQLWYMHGVTRGGFADLVGNSLSLPDASGWHVVGTGDFDGDGNPDILWHHDEGETMVWYMGGFTWLSSATLSAYLDVPSSSGTNLAETDDFNLDGEADLVWWTPATTTLELWLMNGTSRLSVSDIGGAPGATEWMIVPH